MTSWRVSTLQPQSPNSLTPAEIFASLFAMKLIRSQRKFGFVLALSVLAASGLPMLQGAEPKTDSAWRPLPLISNGKVDSNWVHVGYGGFSADNGALRTDCDPKGLGLLVYKKEHLGNCQIRVVFKTKD